MKLSNQTKIAIFSGACLLGLIVILKNIMRVPAEILSRDFAYYVILFLLFGSIFPSIEAINRCKPFYWYLAIIVITVAIITSYYYALYLF